MADIELLKYIKLSFLSLNMRGLGQHKKRRKMYNWLAQHGCHKGIAFIQEAHCDKNSHGEICGRAILPFHMVLLAVEVL